MKINKQLILENIRIEESIIIDYNKLRNCLPKQYVNKYNNFLKSFPGAKEIIKDFYTNNDMYQLDNKLSYIPIGYNNADVLVVNLKTKKLEGIPHGVQNTKKYNIEVHFDAEEFDESLNISIKFKQDTLNNVKSIKELDKLISKRIGKECEIDYDLSLNNVKANEYYNFYFKKLQDALDLCNTKELHKLISKPI